MKTKGFPVNIQILGALLLLTLPAGVQAQFTFTINNGAVIITGYTGSGGNVVIPDWTNGYPVTTIGPDAFNNDYSVTSVTFGTNVTTLQREAFEWAGLTNLTIPANITSIGNNVFNGCPLTTITVNGSNPAYASAGGVLFNKQLTTLVQYPINNPATSYMLPATVTGIADSAFVDAGFLQAITVDPSSSAFSSVGGVLFNWQMTELVLFPAGLSGPYAIPTGVASIGAEAFWGCYGLTSISIPDGVTNIGYDAFENDYLSSITIPSSVVLLGSFSFYDVNGLKSVFFEGNAPQDGDTSVFQGDNGATVYYLPGTSGWGFAFDGLPTMLWYQPNPTILGSGYGLGVTTNGFVFTISWATNRSVVVQAATNLANPVWTPLATNLLVSGTNYFHDSKWTNYTRRFYRISAP